MTSINNTNSSPITSIINNLVTQNSMNSTFIGEGIDHHETKTEFYTREGLKKLNLNLT
jgi:hypothetical protein